jgi:hypothetical protein
MANDRVVAHERSCAPGTGPAARAIVRSDACWRVKGATRIANCGLLNHASSSRADGVAPLDGDR